jgi:hypothetical protein
MYENVKVAKTWIQSREFIIWKDSVGGEGRGG